MAVNYMNAAELCKIAEDKLKNDPKYEELMKACPLDYHSTNFRADSVTLEECDFDVLGTAVYGSSEGIYGDVTIHGHWNKNGPSKEGIYTFKTLGTSKEAFFAMGLLVTMFAYYANETVRENLDRFE